MLAIDLTTARRFILGKQGLWPGRRWRGAEGVEQAMRAIEDLQLDPLQVVARSHDITLHSRVLDSPKFSVASTKRACAHEQTKAPSDDSRRTVEIAVSRSTMWCE